MTGRSSVAQSVWCRKNRQFGKGGAQEALSTEFPSRSETADSSVRMPNSDHI